MNHILFRSLTAVLLATGMTACRTPGPAQDSTSREMAPATDTSELARQELEKTELADDAAHDEVDEWIRKNQEAGTTGAAISDEELNQRIRQRLDRVRASYDELLRKFPGYAEAHLAFASFLGGIGNEEGEFTHLERARELDPNNPAVWNNLANFYGHNGPTKKAFEYYEKAIQLDPTEPVYYHNFGTTVYLFRKDAREYYNIEEQQVFDKALNLYSNSMRLDPDNFELAQDVAQTYYGIRPLRTNDALVSWTNTLALASNEIEREGVYIHLARIKLSIGEYEQARAHLAAVTNVFYDDLKERLERNLNARQYGTNATEALKPD